MTRTIYCYEHRSKKKNVGIYSYFIDDSSEDKKKRHKKVCHKKKTSVLKIIKIV